MNPGDDFYQRTKAEAETWLTGFARFARGLPFTVIRPAASAARATPAC